jgi:hypothetical protein
MVSTLGVMSLLACLVDTIVRCDWWTWRPPLSSLPFTCTYSLCCFAVFLVLHRRSHPPSPVHVHLYLLRTAICVCNCCNSALLALSVEIRRVLTPRSTSGFLCVFNAYAARSFAHLRCFSIYFAYLFIILLYGVIISFCVYALFVWFCF